MIAFRKVFERIPADVAMDEAFVEAFIVKRGMEVKYAPDAIVYNTGPTTIGDFMRQRRRNHAGHLFLKHKYGYAVSSIQNNALPRFLERVVGHCAVGVGALFAGCHRRLESADRLV